MNNQPRILTNNEPFVIKAKPQGSASVVEVARVTSVNVVIVQIDLDPESKDRLFINLLRVTSRVYHTTSPITMVLDFLDSEGKIILSKNSQFNIDRSNNEERYQAFVDVNRGSLDAAKEFNRKVLDNVGTWEG
jgi:hypothetical protein